MSLANAAGAAAAFLKPQTPLQQLLEDINFQRTKEMRQMLKDDSGFVVLQGTTYWTDLFVRHFLFQTEPVLSIDSDDLLFFVRKKHVKSSSRHMPKFETEVEVFRKDSRKLPIGDPDVDWEETVYLNMVIHQFDYTLTLAICTRTSPKELQVLRRHSQRVYASPSRRKMDTKGEGEEITYPHICFMVDNFDEVFSDILVRDGEMVCVELVANDKDGAVQGVIFLGSIRYDALKKVYDARQSSLSSKVAQRMSFGLFSSGAGVQTRCEFVRMKGPQGKGHAEMAVTKPKGSGVETPTSEPGFCATDMWDDWEEENDDYCTYRHQRRLSDPSANLNNFSRYGWRTKGSGDGASGSAGAKARSENEGLDSLANEVSEIEAGDLRDDLRPAFSASTAKLHSNPNCESSNNTETAIESPPALTSPIVHSNNDAKENCIQEEIATEAVDVDVNVNVDIGMADNVSNVTSMDGKQSTTGCSNCFGGKKCKKWANSGINNDTPEMSEVYCPACDVDMTNESPACLNKMPDKKPKAKTKQIFVVETSLSMSRRRAGSLRLSERKIITRSSSLSAADKKKRELELKKERLESKEKSRQKLKENEKAKEKLKERVREKEKEKEKDIHKEKEKTISKTSSLLSKVSPKRLRSKTTEKSKLSSSTPNKKEDRKNKENANNNEKIELVEMKKSNDSSNNELHEYEIADDATSLNGGELNNISEGVAKIALLSESDTKLMITVRGKEELPVVEQPQTAPPVLNDLSSNFNMNLNSKIFEKCTRVPLKTESHPLKSSDTCEVSSSDPAIDNKPKTDNEDHVPDENTPMLLNDCNGNNCDENTPKTPALNGLQLNEDSLDESDASVLSPSSRSKQAAAQQAFYNRALNLVPKRRTPDGTNIYYWCDLPRKVLKELDDGAYNPLWASRGFAQSFHFWKENRRQQSTPLNAFLTYVTLPWWSIAKDLLDHRETPILTF